MLTGNIQSTRYIDNERHSTHSEVFESLPQLLEHVSNLLGEGMKINEKRNMTAS